MFSDALLYFLIVLLQLFCHYWCHFVITVVVSVWRLRGFCIRHHFVDLSVVRIIVDCDEIGLRTDYK